MTGSGARWCPNCRSEYVEGWGTCSTCGVELVDWLPPEPATERVVADLPPRSADGDDDPLVSIWEGPTPEAERVLAVIESAHIPVDLSDATNVGQARVVVPRSYLRDAQDALRGSDGTWPAPIPGDEGSGFDWPPGVKLTLVIVAVVLIFAMLLLS
jgi:hypothetical protein